MKKIIIILCLISGSSTIAQTETAVSPYGKKVIINTNPVRTANNGLTATATASVINVRLDGTLVTPTTLTTTDENTLSVTGLQAGTTSDNVLVADVNGVLRIESQTLFKTEPWLVAGSSTQATTNTQNIYQSGNVGIGTTAPTARLHIKSNTPGAIKIQDGTQSEGAILTSDSNGVANWKQNNIPIKTVKGVPYTGANFNFRNYDCVIPGYDTGYVNYIVLSPGRWAVFINQLIFTGFSPNSNIVSRIGLAPFTIFGNPIDNTFGGTVTYLNNKYISDYVSFGPVSTGNYWTSNCTGSIVLTTTVTNAFYLYGLASSIGGATGGTQVPSIGSSSHNYLYAIKVDY